MDVSSRDLRNNTAEVLRRVEGGERVRVCVNRRPVAELTPVDPLLWADGSTMERVLSDTAADPGMLRDLATVREERIEQS